MDLGDPGPQCPECHTTGDDVWGIEHGELYDGVLYWRCMTCGYAWHRHTLGTTEREVAEQAMKEAEHGEGAP
jgi:rubredoxin